MLRRLFRPINSQPEGRPRTGKSPHSPDGAVGLASVSGRVDDAPGYTAISEYGSLSERPHDYDPAQVQELYQDALVAWRKNPIAWRIIAITTDYIVGDRIEISSPDPALNRFITQFWQHPKNRMDLRLESMSDELARAGDLFVLLFRNPADGMSYIRFVTKDRIRRIETAENDWETELAYAEAQDFGETRLWLSPHHPQAGQAAAIMLHYAVNRPLGALLGESDLTTMIPWLQRYSRMLEDRVRLHWAVRSFLWLVTVPANKILEKREQYRTPPEAGSIIVKDGGEAWEAVTPSLRGADAAHDLQAVRQMIDSGSGYPPHWRGEAAEANLATATAMQAPTERHLLRRQQYFTFILQDILYQAYRRALEIEEGLALEAPPADYPALFRLSLPDISRSDNETLARSARELASALQTASQILGADANQSPAFKRLALRLLFKFCGEPQSEQLIEEICSPTQ